MDDEAKILGLRVVILNEVPEEWGLLLGGPLGEASCTLDGEEILQSLCRAMRDGKIVTFGEEWVEKCREYGIELEASK